jgi:catechol 2,3-dioxygenase-like lactoylglutathione lyase family enzyme
MDTLGRMEIQTLDHVALWVDERDALTDFLVRELAMHVIDRTDDFTLVGGDARRGKLTLFAAEGPRERGVIEHIGVRVPGEAANGSEPLTGPGGVPLLRIQSAEADVADLDHLALRVPDPQATASRLQELGFIGAPDGRLLVGGSPVELVAGDPGEPERPLLNHLGLKVASAEEQIREAKERGLEIAEIKDAANTYAVFVWGPDGIKLEYVEHKPSFSLV